jgi:L-ascorbate metabolism protein UlaG (beta-lactamase superfamily)
MPVAPNPENFDGSRFFLGGQRPNAGFGDLLKWQLSSGRRTWPRWIGNRQYPPPPSRVMGSELSLTWIGHATVLLQTAGMNILTDPLFSRRASPVQWAGPKRVRDPGIAINALPPIDLILLSHNHYDHMDLPALRRLSRFSAPRIVTPLGNAGHIRKARRSFHIDELDWGQSLQSGGARVTLTPALHWSKRGLLDANRSLWGAFVIETAGGAIYFAGDTGYGDGSTFRSIRDNFGTPRLSLLPIGAYEPRWFMKPQHMNPDEAVQAHLDLGSARSLAIHHGTIQLTDEAIDAPAMALTAAMKQRNIDQETFLVPDIGETLPIL